MGVVINEFEVVAEPQPNTQPAETAPSGGSSPATAPTALDIDRVMLHSAERSARVWAH